MIDRDLARAAAQSYDIAIIGGGIYGVCLALEAARRGIKPLLLERDDFGGATSWNSLRIIHGGLRYLQTFDLKRFFESVKERRWFCRTFPDLVKPLPCLMPLYAKGLKRRSVFRIALFANDALSVHRNLGVSEHVRLAGGRLLDREQTIHSCPPIERSGLHGGGLWHDAVMHNSQRLLIELLRWACSCGATALNYVEVTALREDRRRVTGIKARDRFSDVTIEFNAHRVVNCAGPWSRELAGRFDRDVAALFRPSLAFNVLLDRCAPSESAVAVQARRPGSSVLFLYPANGGTLAGTVHVPWTDAHKPPNPTNAQLSQFLDDLNSTMPGFNARHEDIIRVMSGLLPASCVGSSSLARRPFIYEHGRYNGPRNLISVSGVKFTTSRLVAMQTLHRAFHGSLPPAQGNRPGHACGIAFDPPERIAKISTRLPLPELQRLVREESVMNIDDLIHRRTNWTLHNVAESSLRSQVRKLLGWRDDGHYPEPAPVPAPSLRAS